MRKKPKRSIDKIKTLKQLKKVQKKILDRIEEIDKERDKK